MEVAEEGADCVSFNQRALDLVSGDNVSEIFHKQHVIIQNGAAWGQMPLRAFLTESYAAPVLFPVHLFGYPGNSVFSNTSDLARFPVKWAGPNIPMPSNDIY